MNSSRLQFEEFDPLVGEIPFSVFPPWPRNIAARARALLHGYTRDNILEVADNVDIFIESFFRDAEDAFGHDKGQPPPTRDYTTQFVALKHVVGAFDLEEWGTHQEQHYFAALAIRKLTDANKWLEWNDEDYASVLPCALRARFLAALEANRERSQGVHQSLAASCLFEALESVAWGEHLEETACLRRIASDHQLLAAERKHRSKIATDARYRETRLDRQTVWDWCAENKGCFKSREKATDAAVAARLIKAERSTYYRYIGEWETETGLWIRSLRP